MLLTAFLAVSIGVSVLAHGRASAAALAFAGGIGFALVTMLGTESE